MNRISARWKDPRTVSGVVHSPPNEVLLAFARERFTPAAICLDIGCGAGRNAWPLGEIGYVVAGADLALPMLMAATEREHDGLSARFARVHAPMAPLPFAD